jgi:glycerophosphoryl diester phosphodiesterase
MPALQASNRKPILVGHRGACGLAPENTLAAFQVAVDLEIDGVEFDVQLTKDGHPIVFHDDRVQRVTDGTGQVADLTLSGLKTLDAGIDGLTTDYPDHLLTLFKA